MGAEEFADVHILLDDDGGVKVPTHKAILACRSEVCRAMLTCGMRETTSNEIHLKEVSATSLRLLLTYLYTDAVDVHGG